MLSGAMSVAASPRVQPRRTRKRRWIWASALLAGLWVSGVIAAPRGQAPVRTGGASEPAFPAVPATQVPPSTAPLSVPMAANPAQVPATTSSVPLANFPPPSVSLLRPPTLPLPPISLGPDAVEPAVLLQPGAAQPPAGGGAGGGAAGGGNGQLPAPNQLPFGDGVRMPRLAGTGQLGSTPIPTEKDLAQFAQFVEGVVDPRNTLDLVQGRSRVILLKDVPFRTQVADPTIVEFRLLEDPNNAARSGKELLIIGRQPGFTVLNMWFNDPNNKDKEVILSYLVRVLPDPELKERLEAIYKALEVEINKAFPNSRIRLTLVGDKVMITGQAHDVVDANYILRIVSQNAPGQTGPATRPPLSDVRPIGNIFDPLRQTPTPGTESYITPGIGNVINNMRVPGEQQVMLRVTVAEVNRAAARSIGIDFSITNNQGVRVFAQTTGGLSLPGGNLPVILDGGQIPVAIQALRTLSYARSLAEPNLTALNGQPAFFQAGGSFPVPVLGGFGGLGAVGGLQGVQFVPFGVSLNFTPIITDRDRIRLSVQATVSTRDPAAGANVGGTNVPGLNSRSFFTTVDLREGQTMAVAGLIQNSIGADSQRVPFFGDLPYVGKFFGVSRTSAGEQELIVLVTPELVHPLEPFELGPVPGSDIFEPGDLEFYLAGRLESRRSYDYRSPVMNDIHRMCRYRKCEQIYIVGQSGFTDPPPPDLLRK